MGTGDTAMPAANTGDPMDGPSGPQAQGVAAPPLNRARFGLGPPLTVIPRGIEPTALLMYRMDYQAFRAGHATGARGEIGRLCPPVASDPSVKSGWSRGPGVACSPHSMAEEEVYYSEPERDVPIVGPHSDARFPTSLGAVVGSPLVGAAGNAGLARGRAAKLTRAAPQCPGPTTSSSSSPSARFARRAVSVLRLPPTIAPSTGQDEALPGAGATAKPGSAVAVATTAAVAAPATLAVASTTAAATTFAAAGATTGKQQHHGAACAQPRRESAPARLGFLYWLRDEVRSRPDDAQLPRVPRSHLVEVAKVPRRLEKLLCFGFLFCLDILLHELSFMPLQVACTMFRLLIRRVSGAITHAGCRAAGRLTVAERCELLRLTLLLLNVALIFTFFDISWVYHYIRGESFLKLYVIFNMLEMFERWCRSVGVDMFDFVMASADDPWRPFLMKYLATLAYCFVHSTMHWLRILLLSMALNTSSSAVFLIIVTNNFGEIKSTVFKRYEVKSLFPIITSDIVERFYLAMDIIFVLSLSGLSPHRGTYTKLDLTFWLSMLVSLELGTDWVKFCLIMKFSELSASTLEIYKEVLIADVLLCRSTHPLRAAKDVPGGTMPPPPSPAIAAVSLCGARSFSHAPARRIGFSGVPMTTLVVIQLLKLLQSPCSSVLRLPRGTVSLVFVALFVLVLMGKVLLGVVLLGFAARRRGSISKGLEQFLRLKSL